MTLFLKYIYLCFYLSSYDKITCLFRINYIQQIFTNITRQRSAAIMTDLALRLAYDLNV